MDLRKYDLTPEEEAEVRKLDGATPAFLNERMYQDREGEPITLGLWCVLSNKESYKRVALSTIGEGITVSTIWFGCAFLRLYETAIAVVTEDGSNSYEHIYGWRTLEDAIVGHADLVKDLASQIPDALVVDHA